MRDKRGQASVWDVLIWTMVILVAAVIVIFGFRSLFLKETNITQEQFKKCQGEGLTCRDSCEKGEDIQFAIYEDCKVPQVCCKLGKPTG